MYIGFPKDSQNFDVEKEFREYGVISSEPGKCGCYLWFPSVLDAVRAREEMAGRVLGNPDITIEFADEERKVERKRSLSPTVKIQSPKRLGK